MKLLIKADDKNCKVKGSGETLLLLKALTIAVINLFQRIAKNEDGFNELKDCLITMIQHSNYDGSITPLEENKDGN